MFVHDVYIRCVKIYFKLAVESVGELDSVTITMLKAIDCIGTQADFVKTLSVCLFLQEDVIRETLSHLCHIGFVKKTIQGYFLTNTSKKKLACVHNVKNFNSDNMLK